MNEQELIDLVIVERIDMLLHQKKQSKRKLRLGIIIYRKSRIYFQKLPREKWEILNRYIELQGLQMAENESYLYSLRSR
ncbi:MAG: hypothetical protein QM793_04820 [Muricomes sp.]